MLSIPDRSLSNAVETASACYKPQQHFSRVDLCISQSVGKVLEHLDLNITAFRKAVACVFIKAVQYWL